TFFLQLRRGGQVKGLSGMPHYRNGYLRPLLKYRKQELVDLATANGWKWREDLSNTDEDFKRNFYRHTFLSFLRQQNFPLAEVVPLTQLFQRTLRYFRSFPLPQRIDFSSWEKW